MIKLRHLATALIISLFFLSVSCNKNMETFSAEDKETSNNESAQESTTSEIEDLATTVLNSSAVSGTIGGRLDGILDDRLTCAGITIEFTDVALDKTSGKVTITFPADGCLDKRGNIRKGQMVVTWTGGKWYMPGASHTITLVNYTINGVVIEGTQKVTCTAATLTPLSVLWTITGEHKATWPDGTTAQRKVNKTRKWERVGTDDKYTVANGPGGMYAAEGTNRHGRVFKSIITAPLVYLHSCALTNKVFIPVQGQKVVTHISATGKTRSMTIDFGNGVCDNSYVVTAGSITRTLTAKNDSSGD